MQIHDHCLPVIGGLGHGDGSRGIDLALQRDGLSLERFAVEEESHGLGSHAQVDFVPFAVEKTLRNASEVDLGQSAVEVAVVISERVSGGAVDAKTELEVRPRNRRVLDAE